MPELSTTPSIVRPRWLKSVRVLLQVEAVKQAVCALGLGSSAASGVGDLPSATFEVAATTLKRGPAALVRVTGAPLGWRANWLGSPGCHAFLPACFVLEARLGPATVESR